MVGLSSVVRRALVASLVCAALPATSLANGRFPASNYFIAGPGPESRVLALRTTFGLANSYDNGRTWGWVCEEALDAVGAFDASMSVGFDGTLVVGSPMGISVSRSGCSWASPRGNPMRPIVDIASDATGRFMVTAIGPNGVDDTLVLSSDGGASWTLGERIPGFFTETVEMAPSMPSRIYVSGFVSGGIPVMRRSDDGGMTTMEVARDAAFLMGVSAYISGVDPTNPDVVYMRSAIGFGTMLLRSDNGGRTFRELVRTEDQMVGFAMSDDGATVWVASANRAEGILRSVRGGPFRRVAATVTARCLRQHAGVLYVCTDEVVDGYMLGTSIDGGDRIDPLFSGRLLMGVAPMCGASTQVGMVCGPLWPAQRVTLASIDAGPPPMLVPRDAALLDRGAEVTDASDAVVDGGGTDVSDAPGSDIADIADVTDVTGPDVADVTDVPALADVTTDVTDVPGADASFDAPAHDAPVDVTVDVQDATADRGVQPAPDGCACRAGSQGSGAKGSWLAALATALGVRRRRRRGVS